MFCATLHLLDLFFDFFGMLDILLLKDLLINAAVESLAARCPTAVIHCERPIDAQPLLCSMMILVPEPFGSVTAMSLTGDARGAIRSAKLGKNSEAVAIASVSEAASSARTVRTQGGQSLQPQQSSS